MPRLSTPLHLVLAGCRAEQTKPSMTRPRSESDRCRISSHHPLSSLFRRCGAVIPAKSTLSWLLKLILVLAIGGCADVGASTPHLVLTLESRRPYYLTGPARDLSVADYGIVAVEDNSSQLVWLDSFGRETARSEDTFLRITRLGGELYAHHREAVVRVGPRGRIDSCPLSATKEGIEALTYAADRIWALRLSNGLRSLSPLGCYSDPPPSSPIRIPEDAFPVGTRNGFIGVEARRPFTVWGISLSGTTTPLTTLAEASEELSNKDLFLQGITHLGTDHFLALFTDLVSPVRHVIVFSAKGHVVAEARLSAPVGLADFDERERIIYFNISRPTGGEVLAYRWDWKGHYNSGGDI